MAIMSFLTFIFYLIAGIFMHKDKNDDFVLSDKGEKRGRTSSSFHVTGAMQRGVSLASRPREVVDENDSYDSEDDDTPYSEV